MPRKKDDDFIDLAEFERHSSRVARNVNEETWTRRDHKALKVVIDMAKFATVMGIGDLVTRLRTVENQLVRVIENMETLISRHEARWKKDDDKSGNS